VTFGRLYSLACSTASARSLTADIGKCSMMLFVIFESAVQHTYNRIARNDNAVVHRVVDAGGVHSASYSGS
jgi:hypothetical protein